MAARLAATEKVYRVTIFVGESDRHQGKPLYMALLELLRKGGASGATVTRGLAGFGEHHQMHTANILSLSADLPIKIEWVDDEERYQRLLPEVQKIVSDGLITVEQVDVVG